MPKEKKTIKFNKSSLYKWDIEKLRKLAKKVYEIEQEIKEEEIVNECHCHQLQKV